MNIRLFFCVGARNLPLFLFFFFFGTGLDSAVPHLSVDELTKLENAADQVQNTFFKMHQSISLNPRGKNRGTPLLSKCMSIYVSFVCILFKKFRLGEC